MAISGALAVTRQRGFSAIRREMERALGRLRVGIWPVVQTAVAAALAWSVAVLGVGGPPPIVAALNAGVSAVLVVNLDPTTYGVSPDRFLEALVGGSVALAVSAIFPSNPSLRARQAMRPLLEDLATTLRDVAAALIGGDLELAEGALSEAR